jgi:uncharacterized protein (TIGR00255 family)
MIKSMTGYGKSVAEIPGKKITIELKSLNSKSLDLNLRLPWLYKEKEADIRNLLSQKLNRDKTVVKDYFAQLKEIAGELNIKTDDQLLAVIMRLPDALKTEKPELKEDEWLVVKEKILESVGQLDLYRIEEGKSLEADIERCIGKILKLLEEIETFEGDRITRIREKLNNSLIDSVGTENIDMNRFEQELIFYLEKLDINEEKVRLKKHCEYFLEKISSEPPNGKILSFISQEMGREINTIGSKANDASIQKLVVMMKDELEKIKEQTLNIL